eukprot:TRINITY_DN73603_c0_g1_i1.p2 TRINITY_DN73603_c0_g1~~TRINITY_DN73603_c0_g1_i1.p2  ORF type:complete len:458 (+),score=82.10 TRINITY_DN73603_c0_g1_i1:52-1374(+)
MKIGLSLGIVLATLVLSAATSPEFVVLVTRHGVRNPLAAFGTKSVYFPAADAGWWHQNAGSLLPEGYQQHVALGRQLSDLYPSILASCIPSAIRAMADDDQRTTASAVGDIVGMGCRAGLSPGTAAAAVTAARASSASHGVAAASGLAPVAALLQPLWALNATESSMEQAYALANAVHVFESLTPARRQAFVATCRRVGAHIGDDTLTTADPSTVEGARALISAVTQGMTVGAIAAAIGVPPMLTTDGPVSARDMEVLNGVADLWANAEENPIPNATVAGMPPSVGRMLGAPTADIVARILGAAAKRLDAPAAGVGGVGARVVILSGHDSTVDRTAAAIGLRPAAWPQYAAAMVFELSRNATNAGVPTWGVGVRYHHRGYLAPLATTPPRALQFDGVMRDADAYPANTTTPLSTFMAAAVKPVSPPAVVDEILSWTNALL